MSKTGSVTTERVLSDARSEDSPFHPGLEWDDSIAGEEFRKSQVRSMIRAVCVRESDNKPPAPIYYRVTSDGKGVYEPISVIVKDADLFESAREQLLIVLRSAQRSLAELEAAAAKSRKIKQSKAAARIRKHLDEAVDAAALPTT
jgi:hypothetical protein